MVENLQIIMINKTTPQPSLFSSLTDQLNPRHPLYLLANKIAGAVLKKLSPRYTVPSTVVRPNPSAWCADFWFLSTCVTCPMNRLLNNGARMLITSTFAVCWNSRLPIPAMQANWYTSVSVSEKMAWNWFCQKVSASIRRTTARTITARPSSFHGTGKERDLSHGCEVA